MTSTARSASEMTPTAHAKAARRHALALLLSGVVPIAPAPPSDVCSKAPLRGTPPSQQEWSLLAHESIRFRARTLDNDDWINLGDAEWTGGGLRARGGQGWDTGRLIYADSLAIHWADIARLDGQRGNHGARGALLGGAAGAVAFAGLYACDDCDLGCWAATAVPLGMVIGGVIGRWQPIWRPVYCAGPAHAPENQP